MSALNSLKLKTNCDAVNSGPFFINQTISINSSATVNTKVNKHVNHGAKLNQKQDSNNIKQQAPVASKSPTKSIVIKQATSESSDDFQFQSQKFSDVQKVLKQEQELQKQLYSGSNVAPGWLRVNHNNKVIYIR